MHLDGLDRDVEILRYGNKRIEPAPRKPTIEGSDTDKLIPTLETIKEAVIAGELDKQLAAAKVRRKRQKARSAGPPNKLKSVF